MTGNLYQVSFNFEGGVAVKMTVIQPKILFGHKKEVIVTKGGGGGGDNVLMGLALT